MYSDYVKLNKTRQHDFVANPSDISNITYESVLYTYTYIMFYKILAENPPMTMIPEALERPGNP